MRVRVTEGPGDGSRSVGLIDVAAARSVSELEHLAEKERLLLPQCAVGPLAVVPSPRPVPVVPAVVVVTVGDLQQLVELAAIEKHPAATWAVVDLDPLALRVLSARAAEWACDRVAVLEGTPSSTARDFGVAWSTVCSAVERIGRARVDDAERVGPVAMVGFDETVMQPAHRRRRRRFVTAVVDVATGQLLDVFEGRDARQLRGWMAGLAPSWLAQVQVVSVDPHEGYRSAVVGSDPVTGQVSPLSHAAVVVDPFHVVRLANMAVTQCRQRVQQQTLAHRGWKGDPLYDVRKLLLLGAERGRDRMATAACRPRRR